MRTITLAEIFTHRQLTKARSLYVEHGPGSAFHRACVELLKPGMAEINRKTGQDNCPEFLSYTIEHALNQCAASGASF